MNRIPMLLACTALLLTTACGDDDCTEKTEAVAAQSVCTSSRLAENQPLRVDVETVAIRGCGEPTCAVDVQGSDVFVALERDTCGPDVGDACPDAARSHVVTCELPPLVFGSYAVRVNGKPSGVLSVEQGSTDTDCTF